MNYEPIIKANPELLRFSKEALAYYIEKLLLVCSFGVSKDQAIKDLKTFDRYFRSCARIKSQDRRVSILDRLEEIHTALSSGDKMSKRKRIQLVSEADALMKRLRIPKKRKSNGRQIENRMV